MWRRLTVLLLCWHVAAPLPLAARSFSDPLARRVTEFFPTYTPFVPPLPPERYFPDEVGEQVAGAIIDGFLDDLAALRNRVARLAAHDAQLRADGEQPTGVTPLARALLYRSVDAESAASLPIAEMDAAPDDILAYADTLYAAQTRYRVARLFNWLLSTVDVARLFLGAPAGPSPYAAQGVLSTVGNGDGPSARERKALALYRLFLERAPDDPRVPEVEEKIGRLDGKRKRALVEAELERAERAFAEEDYWTANFHYQLALLVDEDAEDAEAGIRTVEHHLRHYEALDRDADAPDPLAGVKQAEWERSKETLTYLLPGSRFVKDNLVVAGLQIGTEGLVGAATFGGLTLLQTLGKVWHLLTGQAVSQQGIITAGEQYLHETPPEERDPEIYSTLAEAYAAQGRLDQAIRYSALAGETDEIPKLQDAAAKGLLKQAEAAAQRAEKAALLRRVVERYPDSEAAKEAREELRDVERPERQGLRLSKPFLRENPDLFGPQGLGLKPGLYDGDWDNLELTDDGIVLSPRGDLTLLLESDDGPRTKVYGVPTALWQQFWHRFREKGHADALARGDLKIAKLVQGVEVADVALKSEFEKRDEAGWRLLPELTGSVGEGFDVRGHLPKDVLGTRLAFGRDERSSYVGVEVPMPLVPVDFLLVGRSGVPSLYPRIRLPDHQVEDTELYR